MTTATGRLRENAGSMNSAALGREVRVQGAVIVQVVLRQVGEGDHRERDPVGATQVESVRRHLHHGRLVAGIDHHRQILLNVDRLGRRALGREDDSADAPLHRAQEAGAPPVLVEQVRRQEGGGRLAVGAGDAHGRQAGAGILVQRGGQPGPWPSAPTGTSTCGTASGSSRSTHSAAAPRVDRLRGEVVAVVAETGDAEEQVTRGGEVAAIRERSHLDIRVTDNPGALDIPEQFLQSHGSGFYHSPPPLPRPGSVSADGRDLEMLEGEVGDAGECRCGHVGTEVGFLAGLVHRDEDHEAGGFGRHHPDEGRR